jgi:DNA-binding NtrC family response regulator
MALLRIIEGYGQGLARELGETAITIGRDPANHIQIADPKASRTHIRITWTGSGHELLDLGSSNGTWNDAGRIDRLPLKNDTLFRIGATYFRYEDAQAPATAGTLADDAQAWRDPTRIETLAEDSSFLTGEHGNQAELARANRYLALLYRIVLRSGQCESRDDLFDLLDDIAADALEGDRCAVFLPDEGGWALWPPHERRLRARFGSVPFARTLLASAREQQRSLLATADDRGLNATLVRAGVRSAMAAPLRTGQQLHGLLYVDRIVGDQPFSRDDLEFLTAVANQLAVRLLDTDRLAELDAEVSRLRQVASKPPPPPLIGNSADLQRVRRFIERAADSTAPVLLVGQPGCGKDLVCRQLHHLSPRALQPFQTLRLAAHPLEHLETALFGSDDGQPGLLELADGGTLCIDEITGLSGALQARLLHVLENGELHRVSDGALRRVDLRLFACTTEDLDQAERDGRLRSDLRHRLDVLSCVLPQLHDHPEDLTALINHFLNKSAEARGEPPRGLSDRARALLLGYRWPGNVRQLRNVLERCVVMAEGPLIEASDLPESIGSSDSGQESIDQILSLAEIERHHILRVLEHCGGNKKATAEMLGIDRSTLYAKLRQYGH